VCVCVCVCWFAVVVVCGARGVVWAWGSLGAECPVAIRPPFSCYPVFVSLYLGRVRVLGRRGFPRVRMARHPLSPVRSLPLFVFVSLSLSLFHGP